MNNTWLDLINKIPDSKVRSRIIRGFNNSKEFTINCPITPIFNYNMCKSLLSIRSVGKKSLIEFLKVLDKEGIKIPRQLIPKHIHRPNYSLGIDGLLFSDSKKAIMGLCDCGKAIISVNWREL